MHSIHDRELLDSLERLGGKSLHLDVWRVTWRTRGVLDVGGGGRWNHPGKPDAIYTSLESDGAIAEIYHHLSRAPVLSSADRILHPLNVRTETTLDLTDAGILRRLGLTAEMLDSDDPSATREVAHAAFLLDHDSLLVPSLRWKCANLVVFPDRIDETRIQAGQAKSINWPAWSDRHGDELARVRSERPSVVNALKTRGSGSSP